MSCHDGDGPSNLLEDFLGEQKAQINHSDVEIIQTRESSNNPPAVVIVDVTCDQATSSSLSEYLPPLTLSAALKDRVAGTDQGDGTGLIDFLMERTQERTTQVQKSYSTKSSKTD